MKALSQFAALLFLLSSQSWAQQRPTVPTYMYNLMTLNPAYTGYHQTLDAALEANMTLPKMEGAPQFGSLSINGPMYHKHIGLGGYIQSHKVGIYENTEVNFSYAYKLFSRNKNHYTSWGFYPKVVSFGLQVGFNHLAENYQDLGIDNDPEFAENISEITPSFGAGLFISRKHFYIGLSAPALSSSIFSSDQGRKLQNHYYMQVGYKALIGPNIFFKPAALLKYVAGAPLQANLNVVFDYEGKFDFGIGYASVAGVNFLAGIKVYEGLKVIYHYDTIIGQNSTGMSNIHGVMLSYRPNMQ